MNRRIFLQSAFAGLALPPLVSLWPRQARADELATPLRMLFLFSPNGMRMEHFTPTNLGSGYDLPPILEPLAPVQDRVSVLTGLANRPAETEDLGGHAQGTASFLGGRQVKPTTGDDVFASRTVDQHLADLLGSGTDLPSLELGLEHAPTVANCAVGYTCTYLRNISWSGPRTPRPKLVDPAVAFDRLFSGSNADLSATQADRRRALKQSVLDYTVDETERLSGRLSSGDRRKLDEYLTGVRELERRLQNSNARTCDPGERAATNLDVTAKADAMNEVLVTALRCDRTRVVTHMLADGGSYQSLDFVGSGLGWHQASHHGGRSDFLEAMTLAGRWVVERFVDLVIRLDAVEEPDGSSLLDQTLLLWSSEISDGDLHTHHDLPCLLAGGGQGLHTPGRHLDFTERPRADLYLTMLRHAGSDAESFGDDGTDVLDLL